ncbi:MAG: DUF2237 domain-containing protein [Planctomycetales bacterium]|nr:DUF2237 domain-containing protein [Planctomycetales bacterium]MCA9167453.1 DUF2237 domain-containing protein [Planctomycetales bacterium]
MAKNVLGGELQTCSVSPRTGFYRDGCCNTGPSDAGLHLVCAEMTAEFLTFSKIRGNDLSTPNPMYDFPGLQPGDRWCLCVQRWQEAYREGVAPRVVLSATHISTLEFVTLEELEEYAADI